MVGNVRLALGCRRDVIFLLESVCDGCKCSRCGVGGFRRCSLCMGGGSFLVSSDMVAFASAGNGLVTLGPSIALSVIGGDGSVDNCIRGLYCGRGICHMSGGDGDFGRVVRIKLRYVNSVSSCYVDRILALTNGDLRTVDSGCILDISRFNVLATILGGTGVNSGLGTRVVEYVRRGGRRRLGGLYVSGRVTDRATRLVANLVSICNGADSILPHLGTLDDSDRCLSTCGRFRGVLELISDDILGVLRVSFSIMDSTGCCGNVIFGNFIRGIPDDILSNNRCSDLVGGVGGGSNTINFTICLSVLSPLGSSGSSFRRSVVVLCNRGASVTTLGDLARSLVTGNGHMSTRERVPSGLACHRLVDFGGNRIRVVRGGTWYNATGKRT